MRYLGKNKNYKRKFENNEEDEKEMKIKSEKGITLINLIIVFLLILILVAVLYLVYANLVGRGIIKTNNNLLSDNIKQEQNINNNQNQQNKFNEEEENNNSDINNTNDNKEDEEILITGTKEEDEEIENNTETTVDISEVFGNSSNTNSGITAENTYKIGDTIKIEKNNMEITINSVEPFTSENGYEMQKAEVTFKNNNTQTLENLSPLYYMIKPLSIKETESGSSEEVEQFLKNNADIYEDNLLEKSVGAGETITGCIYWQGTSCEYLKISAITGIINAENNEYSYGDPFYVIIK